MQVELMAFGNDLTDAAGMDLTGYMVRRGDEVLYIALTESDAREYVAHHGKR